MGSDRLASADADVIDTLESHVASGRIVARKRTTQDDLLLAADWILQYEGSVSDDGPNLVGLASVALMLIKAAARRER
jgi:hypothetical protein